MELNSPKITISKSQKELFEFLTEVKNYEKLMPENIERFEVLGAESFLFQLKGMPEIQLEITEKKPFKFIKLGSLGGKLPFKLNIKTDSPSPNKSEAQLLFEGEFNAMMGMMIKKPIQKFIDTLSGNLEKL